MNTVLQRVDRASVEVGGKIVGQIEKGFLIFLGVCDTDEKRDAEVLADKISGLRIFTDENDKMNLSLADVSGGVLVISNFTLCADCQKGRRPNFCAAAPADTANGLYEYFCERLKNKGIGKVEKGVFGADMSVKLTNDGPVTLILKSEDLKK